MKTKITQLTLLLTFSIFSQFTYADKRASTEKEIVDQAIHELNLLFQKKILTLKSFTEKEKQDYVKKHNKIIKQRNLKKICEQYGNYWQHTLSSEEGVLRLPELQGMKPPKGDKMWTAEEYRIVTDAEVKATDKKRIKILQNILSISTASQQISLLERERQWLISREKEAHLDDQGNPTSDFETVNHWRTYKNCMRIGELKHFYYKTLLAR